MGKEFKVFIIPNKNTIYPEYMPDRYRKIGEQSDIERLYQHFPEAVNMIDVLETAKRANTDDIYHKEDSHWNRLGAYAGYVAIMENFGLQDKVLSYGNYEISDDDKPKNELALDSITRVYVKNALGYFEAFPMAKDEEIQDGHWNYGFSYNLDDEFMPEELYVYSNKSETWTRLTPVINN